MNLWSFTVLRLIVDNKIFKEVFEDQVDGCDDEQFEIRPGEEFSGSVLTSPALAVST